MSVIKSFQHPSLVTSLAHNFGTSPNFGTAERKNGIQILVTGLRSQQDSDGCIYIWNYRTLQLMHRIENAHLGPPRFLELNQGRFAYGFESFVSNAFRNRDPDAVLLLSGSTQDSAIMLWDCESGKCLKRFEFHSDQVNLLLWRGCKVMSAQKDKAFFWEVDLSREHRVLWRCSMVSGDMSLPGDLFTYDSITNLSPVIMDDFGILGRWGSSLRYFDFLPKESCVRGMPSSGRAAIESTIAAGMLGIVWTRVSSREAGGVSQLEKLDLQIWKTLAENEDSFSLATQ